MSVTTGSLVLGSVKSAHRLVKALTARMTLERVRFDDEFLFDNNSNGKEPLPTGLIGRMTHIEWMARKNQEAILERRPTQRAFFLMRSANVGTMRYATSTWSGDNWASWRSLRGSVVMNLNAQMSLMQSYGNDICGFGC
jgi:hypothetical protein